MEMFPHPYKECFGLLPNRRGISQSTPLQGPTSLLALIPLSNRCGISQSTPLQGPVSVLTHRPVSGSDTICNGSSPPLADIFLFGLSLSSFPSRLLNTFVRERLPHRLCSPSPIDVGSHNPTPFRAQRLRWHLFLSPINVESHNLPPSRPNVLVGTLPSIWL